MEIVSAVYAKRFLQYGEKNGIGKGEKTDWKTEKTKFLKRWNFIR